MELGSVQIVKSVAAMAPVVFLAAKTAASMLSNPRLTALVVGILTSAYWLPKAEGGLICFEMCRNTCMAGLPFALLDGSIMSLISPVLRVCTLYCLPFLDPTIP